MLVYGDHERQVDTAGFLADLHGRGQALAGRHGLDWHGAALALFVDLAGLLQGVADRAFLTAGCDEDSLAQATIMTALVAASSRLDASWTSCLADQAWPADWIVQIKALALPERLTIRRCEGYAFYALYPETYLAAARELPAGVTVIGLRSIGTGLAALVTAASAAGAVFTLRPVGEVFDRTVAVGPALDAAIRARADGMFAIVDEGPGLSGSSFGGVANWLEGCGVARDRIVFMPGHEGDPGPRASDANRRRWVSVRRLAGSFDRIIIDGDVPLATWFEDLVGRAIAPLRDVSGGAWREGRDVPADPGREARKFLLTTAVGTFLLKFVGLDAEASTKLDRARQLFAGGFSPEPLALRYGFLIERWVSAAVSPAPVPLARYLAFRARAFPADRQGASLRALAEMARYNIGQAVEGSEARFADWSDTRLDALQRAVRPVHVDARMHAWEWAPTAHGWLKTDAVDHAQAHDLVGCQDIAWDVAGAIVEFDLPPHEAEALIAGVMGDRPSGRDLVAFMMPCYLGFQIGWWSYAGSAQRETYVARAATLISAM